MTPVKILHRIRPRRIAGLVAALAAVVATAGCAGAAPDVAAYVGPSTISDSRLQEVTVAADAIFSTQGARANKSGLLSQLVVGEITDQLAEQRGIRISEGERNALLSNSPLASLVGDDRASELANAWADSELVRMRVGDQVFVQSLLAAEVRLNPRYGTWQPDAYLQNKSSVGAGSESLSVPLGAAQS